jgi:tetratricopeptide (TPR) repeat protein
MARVLTSGLAICLMAGVGSAQQVDPQTSPDSRTVLGGGNDLLAAGAELIRAGEYEDGIRLTTLGLERSPTIADKAAALSNLCAAHAAKGDLDLAIKFCTQSLEINEKNWRAYSNRSYAFYLKGMYAQANADLEAAAAISPNARQVMQIRGMINERNLRPSVIMEDHR